VRPLVVGTAGHIDHGKSALVEALTGTHPDRLEEEKRRGITIDLGFADLDLGGGRTLSFVDVPGHERFVRHMVAGAAGVDAVLLAIASDEGPKPQTREHLAICSLLAISHGIVAMTKSDLVDPDVAGVVRLEIAELLEGTFLEAAPLLTVSARSGEGLAALRAALAGLFDRVAERPRSGAVRLPVDRSFSLRGFGTVVTGTLYAGTLREGQDVEVLPGRRRARVRGLEVHHCKTTVAEAGSRVAVNLQGIDVPLVPRGSTLSEPGSLRPTRRVWADLRFLSGAPDALRTRGGTARFHHGTCERWATVRMLGGGSPRTFPAEILLDEETVLLPGDRFVLRRPRPVDTLGGGVVVDAHPPGGGKAARARREGFAALASSDPVLARVERTGADGVSGTEIAVALGLPVAEVERGLERLSADGTIVRAAGRAFPAGAWSGVEEATVRALGEFHGAEPLRSGMRREDLRSRVARGWSPEVFRTALDRLFARGAVRLEGERVALAGHRVVLSDDDQSIAERLDRVFRAAGLEPPDADATLRDAGGERARRVLEVLVERGRLVRIVDGRLFHAQALDELRAKLATYARRSRTIDVAAFKELAGVTRKNAIPLLEQLDAERRTRRTGNVREILFDGAA
jgi:selenocysteine-specific elongation factor